jgi:hypothetical protein
MSEIELLIHETIDEINKQTPPDRRIDKSPQAVIVGIGSTLDSLGIINFLVSLEAKVAVATGCAVSLLSEEALTDSKGPLHTVESIRGFILRQM